MDRDDVHAEHDQPAAAERPEPAEPQRRPAYRGPFLRVRHGARADEHERDAAERLVPDG